MNRDVIVWGIVGGLSFLVLLTAYELVTGWRATLAVKFGVALVVTLVTTVAGSLLAMRVKENGSA